MRKRIWIALAGAGVLAAVIFYAAPFQTSAPPLAGWFPSGSSLYLEAKDFSAELRAWNQSAEKQRWLASARYEGFSRSNLFLKLDTAWQEFTAAGQLLPEASMLDSIAGKESALALYDIGNLEFLYVTRLAGARAIETAMWESRAKYEPRRAGNFDFFVRRESGRTVAFAVAGDYLLLGTREELVAGALRLLSGERLTTLQDEAWYHDSVSAAGAPGDVRLATNLEALVKSPQYRSYWIHRNASEVRNYRAAVSDLERSRGEIREERFLLRQSATAAVAGSVEPLLRLAPETAALVRAYCAPAASQVAKRIEEKLLAPKPVSRRPSDYAPVVEAGNGQTGNEADLETRIDEPPLEAQSAISLDDLTRVLGSAPLSGVLEVQTSRSLSDGVFVDTPSVLAIEAARPWDGAAVRRALTNAAASVWTTAGAGTAWVEQRRGARRWYAMEGLARLQMAVDGNLLLLANSEEALGQVLDRIDRRPAASDAVSVAVFRHSAARADYRRMMMLLDQAQPGGYSRLGARDGQQGQRPRFFADDLWSLSEVFNSVQEVEVRTQDAGAGLREAVTYRLR